MTAKIGVLAVQGAFIEHEKMLEELGAEVIEKDDRDNSIKIEDRDTWYKGWFFERGESYSMEDIHPLDDC